jgi:hypothetical protein
MITCVLLVSQDGDLMPESLTRPQTSPIAVSVAGLKSVSSRNGRFRFNPARFTDVNMAGFKSEARGAIALGRNKPTN